MAGAKPVFVDVEEDGFCLDPEKVEAAITDRTKAIHPVHLYGELADMPSFLKISEKHNLLLIEDSAQFIAQIHGTVTQEVLEKRAGLVSIQQKI